MNSVNALVVFAFGFVGLAGRPAGFWAIGETKNKIVNGRSVRRRALRVLSGRFVVILGMGRETETK
jgi:hypothetical protein